MIKSSPKVPTMISYADKMYDQEFVRKCMAGRVVEVGYNSDDDDEDQVPHFKIRTKKTYQQGIVSYLSRVQDDFEALRDHIDNIYGGHIIPILTRIDAIDNPKEAASVFQTYMSGLLSHRTIRNDPYVFGFCFVQQQETIKKSRYQKFLTNAIELSRKHLSRVLTRQDKEELSSFDEKILAYKDQMLKKKKQFLGVEKLVASKHSQHQAMRDICSSTGFPFNSVAFNLTVQLTTKCQDINTIFAQMEEAYHRRIILVEHIKQLKANCIRHKAVGKTESTQKALQVQRHKYLTWSQSLLGQMECNLVILDCLVKEILAKCIKLEGMSYEAQV